MKSKTTAVLLCFFLGGLGIHRFYLGQIGYGILYIFTLGGFFGLLPLIDFFVWILSSKESFDDKYNTHFIARESLNTQKEILKRMKANDNIQTK